MRVLFLEDDVLVARGLTRACRSIGLNITHVANVHAAVEALQTEAPFDVVITDYQLRCGESGLALLKWLRSNQPRVRRVLTSGVAEVAALVDGSQPETFLCKPFSIQELQTALIVDDGMHRHAPALGCS